MIVGSLAQHDIIDVQFACLLDDCSSYNAAVLAACKSRTNYCVMRIVITWCAITKRLRRVRRSYAFLAAYAFPILPWELQGLTANSRTVPAPQLRLLGSWAPFWADYLASVIIRCRYTMLIMMIALLFMCRCGLWVRDLLLFRPLFSLNSSGIWC